MHHTDVWCTLNIVQGTHTPGIIVRSFGEYIIFFHGVPLTKCRDKISHVTLLEQQNIYEKSNFVGEATVN